MKKFLVLVSAIMMMFLAIVPMTGACAESNSTTLYVSSENGKGVRMRSDASTEATVLYQLNEGTQVTVLAYVNTDWAYVKAEGRTRNGYIMRKFLSATDPTTLKQTFKAVKAYTVTASPTRADGFVNLRARASKSSQSINHLYAGDKLTVTAESRAFFKVTDQQGNVGYVVKAYVK